MTGQSIERHFQIRAAEQSRKIERNQFEQSLATDSDTARLAVPNEQSFVH